MIVHLRVTDLFNKIIKIYFKNGNINGNYIYIYIYIYIIRLINKTPNHMHNTYKIYNTDLLFFLNLILNIYDLIN